MLYLTTHPMKVLITSTLAFLAIASTAVGQNFQVQGTAHFDPKSGSIYSGSVVSGSIDSLFKRWKVDTSGTVIPWRKFYDEGSGMKRGTLLDNRSESDGFIKDGQKFYIRNFRPEIDPKPVVPGSTIYPCK
jgi:hypothetical protein